MPSIGRDIRREIAVPIRLNSWQDLLLTVCKISKHFDDIRRKLND